MDHRQRRGRPLGKKKKTTDKNTDTCVQDPHSSNPDPTILADDLQETDSDKSDSDFGEDNWDPHAGTKPSPLDGEASDEHWDSGDEAKSEEFNLCMVEMLSELQDNDPQDLEWKPMHRQKKLVTKTG